MIQYLRRSASQHFSTQKIKTINKPIVDYNQRGQYRSPLALKVGDVINQFQVTHHYNFPDFQINTAAFVCKKYGTQWVHFDCQQQKNSLALIVKCKQTPHIVKLGLQKLLHCGSKKYPIRNPIQFMTRRSFNPQNFGYVTNDYIFNAYQTTLLHDHRNLMEVFLNMMFNPLLRQEDFKQAIWRYQFQDANRLEIVGQIANDVKGLWNFSQNQIFDAIQRQLLLKQGMQKPNQIINIKFENMIQWYHRTFTPHNLLILSHGDLHPAKLMTNYRKITQQFKWNKQEKISVSLNTKEQNSKQSKENNSIKQSKTIKIQHIQNQVPLVLSYKIQNVSSNDRILLSILSYILFDMPEAPFMKWNTPDTPYPKHYGFQGNYFNIGITFFQKDQNTVTQKQFLEQQKLIRQELQQLCKNKIPDSLIQQCLYHLQSEYYSTDGLKIMTGCLENLLQLGPSSLQQSLNVRAFISRILRNYRKENIFEQLIKKHLIDNQKYIRIWGKRNPQLFQDREFQEKVKLKFVLQNLSEKQKQQINQYRPPDVLQDYKILPKININQLQIFQQKSPTVFHINEIPIYHSHKCDGIKVTIKYDITDIQQQQIKLLPIICQSYPFMGARGISSLAFDDHISMYIKKMWMNYQTCKTNEGMKIFAFLNIQFSQRNAQFGFNLCKNLVNDHNDENFQILSKRIQRKASQYYNQLSQNLVEIHGRHIGGTRSPYAMIQDPIFLARSTCGIASDIMKIANPKQMLQQLSFEIRNVTKKFSQKNRISVLFQSKRSNIQKYKKYLQLIFNPIKGSQNKLQVIKDKDFSPSPCMKYFPNYNDQYVFEAFSAPYYQNLNQLPSIMVLSAIINQNIKRFNQFGGCFLFKGSLVAYIKGGRKKVLQLQNYYKNIQDVNEAKRFIFQKFKRYTAADLFYTGVSAQQARIFKQAVAMVEQQNLKQSLHKYILSAIKQQSSSILALGPHLSSYEPIIKKGWSVQRSIQGMSLRMEAQSVSVPKIQMSKYLNIY